MENRMIDNLNEMDNRLKEIYEKLGRSYYEDHFEDDVINEHYADFFLQIEILKKERNTLEVKKLAKKGLRRCEVCQQIITIDSAFCNKCGAKLEELPQEIFDGQVEEVKRNCRVCGQELENGDAFCPYCGNKQ